jgi:hypothetical protein
MILLVLDFVRDATMAFKRLGSIDCCL